MWMNTFYIAGVLTWTAARDKEKISVIQLRQIGIDGNELSSIPQRNTLHPHLISRTYSCFYLKYVWSPRYCEILGNLSVCVVDDSRLLPPLISVTVKLIELLLSMYLLNTVLYKFLFFQGSQQWANSHKIFGNLLYAGCLSLRNLGSNLQPQEYKTMALTTSLYCIIMYNAC